ncbi:hypothetical protein CANCADRAFT_24300 [Tortispora caseinolytica NRRL Y-17796]|uniref:Queuine tRNA-ribosyltransferase catalytic subunit 1 n=1 Tax=Tortispora caseinolytica NRRL Y-17796 TaxID=767744 RepID=A0A1E4TH21_9ASCO|nr:hypothetical protein CANCADRAFT_24300 [Tortispora caseinolytica NRRL Y-17796]
MKKPLSLKVVGRCSSSKARATDLVLPHGIVKTPVFMPVATQASLKGLTPEQLAELGCSICLNNTYHLGLKPGQDVLDAVGGAHKLQSWEGNILTDSGGFQMVSLLKLATITEDGVQFLSPHDGSPMLLTPEHSMSLQNSIGADIMMQLDDVVSTLTTGARLEEATNRSIRWLDRCIASHKRPETQNLFCIIQGGLDLDLRKMCVKEMVARDTPGIAIGGLSGGEEKQHFCEVVDLCTTMLNELLPEPKPIYCMGIGFAEDLIVSVALGVDMFDCVFPTRTARFGTALTRFGNLNMRHARYASEFKPLEDDCTCPVCRSRDAGGFGITRAYLHQLAGRDTTGAHLLTLHNVAYQLRLMSEARQAIIEDRFPAYVSKFFKDLHGSKDKYPQWAIDALRKVNIDIL